MSVVPSFDSLALIMLCLRQRQHPISWLSMVRGYFFLLNMQRLQPILSVITEWCFLFLKVHCLFQGDSGSPLVAHGRNGRWEAVGLVSWRTAAGNPGGGCSADTYTVFTEISYHLAWISGVMGLQAPLL